jgi:hypothetical protein
MTDPKPALSTSGQEIAQPPIRDYQDFVKQLWPNVMHDSQFSLQQMLFALDMWSKRTVACGESGCLQLADTYCENCGIRLCVTHSDSAKYDDVDVCLDSAACETRLLAAEHPKHGCPRCGKTFLQHNHDTCQYRWHIIKGKMVWSLAHSPAVQALESQPLPAFPAHKCGLYLTHNQHRDYYEPLDEYLSEREFADTFESPEAMQRAIDTDEHWHLQWYPDTPVGFCHVSAPTLAEVLRLAMPAPPVESLSKSKAQEE